jgi:hypothetical protein
VSACFAAYTGAGLAWRGGVHSEAERGTSMDELKSAWEIAQERATRLGRLSAAERREQEQQGYRQIGEALAQKWLGPAPQPDPRAELDRQDERGRETIRQALIGRLAEAIDLVDAQSIDRARRAIEGIASLGPELQPQAQRIAGLLQEYEGAEQKLRQELEVDYREVLHRLRISGPAVGAINLEPSDKWQVALSQLRKSFAPALDELKRSLVS